MAGVGVNIGEQNDHIGELQLIIVVLFVNGITPVAGEVLLHQVDVVGVIVQETGLVGLAVADLHIFAVLHHRAVLGGQLGILGLGQVTHRVILAVIHKVKESGIVGAVHIHIFVGDILFNVFAAGVHRVFQCQAVAIAQAAPVHTVVITVAGSTIVVVQQAVIIIQGVLLHDNRLAFVDIQGLPGQDQLEELVTAGTDGANLINIVVIIEHRHKAGDAAFHLDFKQHLRLGKATLRAGVHKVVHHKGGNALALGIIFAFSLAGQHVGFIRGQGRGGFRGSLGLAAGGVGFRRNGRDLIIGFAAGNQDRTSCHNGQSAKDITFHRLGPLFCSYSWMDKILPGPKLRATYRFIVLVL